MAENIKEPTIQTGEGAEVQDKEPRLFTQEEVNGIVQARIARVKEQGTKDAEAEYNQKLQELNNREMKLLVREKLSERGMSKKLADVITCTDEADLDAKLDALHEIYGDSTKNKEPGGRAKSWGYRPSGGTAPSYDPIRSAMGLKG